VVMGDRREYRMARALVLSVCKIEGGHGRWPSADGRIPPRAAQLAARIAATDALESHRAPQRVGVRYTSWRSMFWAMWHAFSVELHHARGVAKRLAAASEVPRAWKSASGTSTTPASRLAKIPAGPTWLAAPITAVLRMCARGDSGGIRCKADF